MRQLHLCTPAHRPALLYLPVTSASIAVGALHATTRGRPDSRPAMVAKVDSGMGVKGCEFGVSRYKLLSIGWINSKVLLHSTGNILNIL